MEKVSLADLLTKDIRGKVVCFPTDTVYGVGGMIDDEVARQKIFAMKHRDPNKPLAILTPNQQIDDYVAHVSKEARKWMDEGWPGALTLIFKKSEKVDLSVTSGKDTVGFRMPNSKVALAILEKFGLMATTSVNLSGEAPLNSVEDIEKWFSSCIDYLVTDLEVSSKIPSRVIDVSGDEVKILR